MHSSTSSSTASGSGPTGSGSGVATGSASISVTKPSLSQFEVIRTDPRNDWTTDAGLGVKADTTLVVHPNKAAPVLDRQALDVGTHAVGHQIGIARLLGLARNSPVPASNSYGSLGLGTKY
jgi:hypothetical protein